MHSISTSKILAYAFIPFTKEHAKKWEVPDVMVERNLHRIAYIHDIP
jgi:hypothetical protein